MCLPFCHTPQPTNNSHFRFSVAVAYNHVSHKLSQQTLEMDQTQESPLGWRNMM